MSGLRAEQKRAGPTGNDLAVLAIVRASGQPLSAYDILDRWRTERPQVAPPTVYRALARLSRDGLVHRVESLNAWFAPAVPSAQGSGIISICDDCGTVDEHEAPEALAAVTGALGRTGFHPTLPMVEVHGRCGACDGASSGTLS